MTRRLRFFGTRSELLCIGDGISVHDASGDLRLQVAIENLVDAVAVRDQIWCATHTELVRFSHAGDTLGSELVPELGSDGRLLQSSTAPQLPVWLGPERSTVLRRGSLAVPAGDLVLPIAERRWLSWTAGFMRLHHREAQVWQQPIAEPGRKLLDVQLVFDGRLVVIAQAHGEDTKLTVAATASGAVCTQLRLAGVQQLAFDATRGLALARTEDCVAVIDLRFGRTVRELALPRGVEAFAIDAGFQRVAMLSPAGLEIHRPEELVRAPVAEAPSEDDGDLVVDVVASCETDPEEAEADEESPLDDWALDAPLVRLSPVALAVSASDDEIAHAFALELGRATARVGLAIAHGWDSGRISRNESARPPFAAEVEALLGLAAGRAPAELAAAHARLEAIELEVAAHIAARRDRATPLDVLCHELRLSPASRAILIAIAAPRLDGDLARLHAILANDTGRALVDEHLLAQVLSGVVSADEIARELDLDRPLRKYGLVEVGEGDRLFASLAVDPVVARLLANRSLVGEEDPYLSTRAADRTLEELALPEAIVRRARDYLCSDDPAPPRITLRGRSGAGRHALAAALAARAGRSLGVVDITAMPRDGRVLPDLLRRVLGRARVRGLVPCVDGIELVIADDPKLQTPIASVLAEHPGAIVVRLPPEGSPPCSGLVLDLPARTEHERLLVWERAMARHDLPIVDAGELAARYRVGPGIVERVCAGVALQGIGNLDTDVERNAAWTSALDAGVRAQLDHRLGSLASRVSRLATWNDIVLPEDVLDSLRELTARVAHRKQVFEEWGYERSITTARGITALFTGGPGTGKTMVAGVIARELGLDLYRVDVSRITSKWIGETEKNLASVFDAAEDGQVILLFDEADSLFAKRTEVRSSVDRYANMEVNYLLQRLDSFEGIAILTTNFGTSLDPAFKRRLTYRVTFPFPDEEMRAELWRSLIPPQVPIAGAFDFSELARRFRMSGGYIRNAALRAAFLAADESVALTQAHLERAVRMEFREIGKLADSGTLE